MIYKINGKKLQHIREKSVLERKVQDLIGENLDLLMNLEFVEFEYSIDNIRIDILAFDRELNAPVIIELKKDNSKSLFDQGMEYFHILLNRKSDFVLKMHQNIGLPADEKKISWENSRVIFVGKNFSLRQKRAVNFSNISIELYDYDFYENDIFKLDPIGLDKQAKLETSKLQKDTKIAKISREIKTYDREHHRKKSSPETWDLFKKIETEFLSWDDVEKVNRQDYIDFKINKKSFCSVVLGKSFINVRFGRKKLNTKFQSQNINIKFIGNKGRWGNGIFEIDVDINNLDEVFYVLKQNYKVIKEL